MTATYEYDPLGRRRSKVVNGIMTKFASDAREEIEERNAGNVVLRKFGYGSGVDDRVVMIDAGCAGGGRCFYLSNWQSSVTTLAQQNGVLMDAYHYGPYGESLGWTPTDLSSTNSFRFTGRRIDFETGLYYLRARYYSPSRGRFLQTDPIGSDEDLHLYAYVGNDPVSKTDPSGECGPPCIGALVGRGVELAFQIRDPNVRADYARAGGAIARAAGQLVRGDFSGAASSAQGAVDAAGSHVADVGISAAAGAVGAFGTGKVAAAAGRFVAEKGGGVVAQVVAQVAGAGAVQGATSAGARAASNAVNDRDLGDGVPEAAAVGAVVGGGLHVALSAAERALTQGAVPALSTNAGRAVTGVVRRAISGAAKKEAGCEIRNGEACP